MKTNTMWRLLGIAPAFWLAACANQNGPTTSAYPSGYSNTRAVNVSYGVVDSIQLVQESSNTSGVGAVVGGLAGGVLGNQFGGGSGQTVATIVGAVGGAVAGNEIERNRAQANQSYQISVRLDDGSYRTVRQDSIGDLRVGNRARIDGDRVYRY